ncbi:MAG: TIGR00366 family protein [Planctomycetota bacterium]
MERLGRFFARLAQRYLPDPFVLALVLTLGVMVVAWLAPQNDALRAQGMLGRPAAVARLWIQGLANTEFLAFPLQMCLILLTGFALAKAPVATRLLDAIADTVRTNRGAAGLVALVSCTSCWINWGFGLIASGLLAARIRARFARLHRPCNYPLIVASAYVGMMIWHGGLSGSAPLKVTEGVPVERYVDGRLTPVQAEGITVNRTILSPANLALSAVLLVGIPCLARSMAGGTGGEVLSIQEDQVGLPAPRGSERDERGPAERTPAEALDHAPWLRTLVVLVALAALVVRVWEKRWGAVDLTFVILSFLTVGLLLHRDIVTYIAALTEGGRAVVGIVIQFPLYAGIQGLMAGAGLAAAVAHGFVNLSDWCGEMLGLASAVTFPIATFISACIINLFIPSGGGQWIVQGPIMCSAAEQLGLPLNQTVMAVAYGDELTNMVQPFWAIPLMGLSGVHAREFMGYCALLMLLATPAFAVALLCF